MISVVLRIFFSGLIAFVNDRPSPDMMSAYFVKGMGHRALLQVEAVRVEGDPAKVDGAGCMQGSLGGGKFNFKCSNIKGPVDIYFQSHPRAFSHRIDHRPKEVRPFNIKEASNLSWLVHMSSVDGNKGVAKALTRALDTDVPLSIAFDWKTAETCHLDQVGVDKCEGENCSFEVYPMRFGKSISSTSGHVQAVAEVVMFELEIPSNVVQLVIAERWGTDKITLDLDCSSGKCPDLLFSNNSTLARMDHSEEVEDVGLHFKNYYVLAAGTAEKRFPVRLRENVVSFPIEDRGQLFTCEPAPHETDLAAVIIGAQTRIICPMVMFEDH
jgi:hypothetical protein